MDQYGAPHHQSLAGVGVLAVVGFDYPVVGGYTADLFDDLAVAVVVAVDLFHRVAVDQDQFRCYFHLR